MIGAKELEQGEGGGRGTEEKPEVLNGDLGFDSVSIACSCLDV